MTEIKITWATNCFNCGHEEALVYSTVSRIGLFHDGDEVKCLNCGHTGIMMAEGEDTDILWDEGITSDLPETVVKSLGEVA